MRRMIVVNPATSCPSYYTAEVFATETGGIVQVADLAIATVAAFAPAHWDIVLVDEAIRPIEPDPTADFVAITGKVSQRDRMIELARAYRRLGCTVIIGGSFASLTPDDMRPHADILVTGELEDIAESFFADLESGDWRDHYEGGKADITRSPVPRWDLYPVTGALWGALQTTRGCPFNCEFCDVIQYQGRKQRHKTMDQILAELDALYTHGFRSIFLVDDNFTVHRRHANAVLDTLIAWNEARPDDPCRFTTQASLDLAREDELLDKCRRAGLHSIFVGIETPNEESLRETGKKQNLLLPMHEAIGRIVAHGVAVQAGMIVGFDHDGPSIFQVMFDFLQASPVADVALGPLSAPRATDLFRRLTREGRIRGEVWEAAAATPFATNIEPMLMSQAELLLGVRRLTERLYAAEHFERRMLNFIDAYDSAGADAQRATKKDSGSAPSILFRALRTITRRGEREAAMVTTVLRRAAEKPQCMAVVAQFLARYAQIRYVLDHYPAETPVGPMKALVQV